MTRAGSASSSRSNKSNSTSEALREKRLKLMPPGTVVAPRGELCPVSSVFTPIGFSGVLSRTRAIALYDDQLSWSGILFFDAKFKQAASDCTHAGLYRGSHSG